MPDPAHLPFRLIAISFPEVNPDLGGRSRHLAKQTWNEIAPHPRHGSSWYPERESARCCRGSILGAAVLKADKLQQLGNIAHRLGEVAAESPEVQAFDGTRMTERSLAASI